MTLVGKSYIKCKRSLKFFGHGDAQSLLLAAKIYVSVVVHSEPALYEPVQYGIGQAAGDFELYCIANHDFLVGFIQP